MGKFDMWARIMNAMSKANPQVSMPNLTRKQLKRLRPTRYKPAFSMGYRGTPKQFEAPGQTPAPTIDQVRRLERKYGQKLHVRLGVMHFASDGVLFDKEEAKLRSAQS